MEAQKDSLVIDGRLHIQGEDGLYRRLPIGMDEAREKADHPVYRLDEDGPVAVNPKNGLTAEEESMLKEGHGDWFNDEDAAKDVAAQFGMTPEQMADAGMYPDGTPYDSGPDFEAAVASIPTEDARLEQ